MAMKPPDLHPDDQENRRIFRQRLIDLRQSRGMTCRQLGEARGVVGHTACLLERTDDCQFSKAQAWAHALRARVIALPHSLVVAGADVPLLQPEDADRSHAWDRVMFMGLMVGLRERMELTQRDLAQRLGIGHRGVNSLEQRTDWMVISMQRYARACGDVLDLTVEVEDE